MDMKLKVKMYPLDDGDIIEINGKFYMVTKEVESSKHRLRGMDGYSFYGDAFNCITDTVLVPFKHYPKARYELQLVEKER